MSTPFISVSGTGHLTTTNGGMFSVTANNTTCSESANWCVDTAIPTGSIFTGYHTSNIADPTSPGNSVMYWTASARDGGDHPDPNRTNKTMWIAFYTHNVSGPIAPSDGMQIGGVTLDANSHGKLVLLNGSSGAFLKMNGIWEVYTNQLGDTGTVAAGESQLKMYRVADLDWHTSLSTVDNYIAEIRPGSGATYNGESIEGNQYQLQSENFPGYSVDNQPFEFTEISP